MEIETKCSLEEHKDINAIKYCPKCGIYLCNKCENMHCSLLKNHKTYNINKKEEIFSGFCKEKGHYELKYFCKDHNQLCCASCIAKLNKKGEGQHKDCDVCYINEIKEEKKNKLKENIKYLEEIQNQFNINIESLKKLFQNIEKEKEQLKLEIQNIFTKIRTALNEREDELISEVDKLYKEKYFDEDIIKKGEKFPKQIKSSIEKGKSIDKEWDNDNLISYINDCINIENNIKDLSMISKNINKGDLNNEIKIKFGANDKYIFEQIKLFGKIYSNKYSFSECPMNIIEERKYALSDNNKVLTKTGTDCKWMAAICQNELDKSIEEHKWKIKILRTNDKIIFVGVAPSDFDINYSDFSNCGWYFHCAQVNLYSGPPFNYNGKSININKVKDEITVVVNMKKRTLKFITDDENVSDAYSNIPIDKPLFPAVILYHTNDSVEISEC